MAQGHVMQVAQSGMMAGYEATVAQVPQRLTQAAEIIDALSSLAAVLFEDQHLCLWTSPSESTCGHVAVQHGDHVDYLHDGHRHAAHGDHYDEH